MRHLSKSDQWLGLLSASLRTLCPQAVQATRSSPAENVSEVPLSHQKACHAAGLMRVNHTGEICAQALYQGQALTAQLAHVRTTMEQAALEEEDHLAWCQTRLQELNSKPSYLNPIFYGLSFAMGAITGKLGDKWSLGFVAATEEQVCRHIDHHLDILPKEDHRSRAILNQMRSDEQQHATSALAAGGTQLPIPIKMLMRWSAKIMTHTTYRL